MMPTERFEECEGILAFFIYKNENECMLSD